MASLRSETAGPLVLAGREQIASLFSFGKKWAIHAILGSISLALILVALLVYRSVDKELTDIALIRRTSVVNLAAATLSEKFARLTDIGVSLATRVRFRQLVADGKWVDAIEILRDVPRDLPVIDRLFLVNAEGTLMVDSPEIAGARGQDLAQRDWYKGVSRGLRPYVSAVYARNAVPQLNVFAVAVPIPKDGGGVAGILVLQVRVDWHLFRLDQGNRHRSRGRRLHRGPEWTGGISRFRHARGAPVAVGEGGAHIAVDPTGKEETIFAYALVESYGWSVVTEQPTRASLGLLARDHQLRRLLFGDGLLLLLSISIAYLVYRTVVQRRQADEGQRQNSELERRVAERTAQLEAINGELESFSYSVSHDLRAPLRSLDGFSMVLLEDYGEKLDEEGKDALNRIRAGSQRMGCLIDDMLRLSHVTRAGLNVTQVDLARSRAKSPRP